MKIMPFVFASNLFFLLFLIPIVNACFSPTDSFASEVVLNKPGLQYNLGLFLKGRNFLYQDNEYIFQSQYNDKLAVILSEPKDICETNCLDLKLQIPVENEEARFPYFSIISSVIAQRKVIVDINYKDWNIFSSQKLIEFRKEQISILVSSIGNKHDVIIEINSDLSDCKECTGKCIHSSYKDACISVKMKEDIEEILGYSGLIKNFDDLFVNSRVVGGERTLSDLNPVISKEIDWEEAMRQELVWLKSEIVINIEDKDIEEIASLAKAGRSGYNSRIIYSEENNKWEYYYETSNPLLSNEIVCEEFPLSNLPKNQLDFKGMRISVFYLVPLVSALSLIVILIVLFFIARKIVEIKNFREKKADKER